MKECKCNPHIAKTTMKTPSGDVYEFCQQCRVITHTPSTSLSGTHRPSKTLKQTMEDIASGND